MSKKKFTCVLSKDYYIINNNVDDLTYYLQDGNDVVLIINLINGLVEENEQLKSRIALLNEQQSTISRLEDENEQLQKELNFYDKIINFFASNPMTKYSSKESLIEEMKIFEKNGWL